MTGFDIDNSKFGQGQEQISRKDKINYSTIRMGTGSRGEFNTIFRSIPEGFLYIYKVVGFQVAAHPALYARLLGML